MAELSNFKVYNNDIIVRFFCSNHKDRVVTAIKNLYRNVDNDGSNSKVAARFSTDDANTRFSFNGYLKEGTDIRHEAVFFENTDYPLIVRGKDKELDYIKLIINDHEISSRKSSIISNDGELYGSLNFGNQVGITDLTFEYKVKGQNFIKKLWFTTEVLSYKLDYRSDMKTIISDIEHEYALLSASFLKDTYLSIRSNPNCGSNPLIWWQIFKSCYREIIESARQIIDRPKRRLKIVPKYERVERMPYIPRELENEYLANKNYPSHLYRVEEMALSHDTIENRFLKYVLREVYRIFVEVKNHIVTAMYIDNPKRIDHNIDNIENELLRLNNSLFFRGIGQFKGFTQDNLVMKQALGYKTILEKWVELQQGYELEEGMRKLEVKEISDLYEIWCFIKVKNIVQKILSETKAPINLRSNGNIISNDFIPQLIYGGEVEFVNNDRIELASVSYNAQVEKAGKESAISKTNTVTTVQRPDIVLRLSKTREGIKYTYLFDAKYRIDDQQIGNYDVPPEDAIDQMHRYRDAIYYTGDEPNNKILEHQYLKKEIIAGYVLFPGLVKYEALKQPNAEYYYQKSNSLIGIGAFPLRPDQEIHASDGSVELKADSSELALEKQIRKWLSEDNDKHKLLEESIPQHGLYYNTMPPQSSLLTQHHLENYLNNNILIGTYHDSQHLSWIMTKDEDGKMTYNIRLGGNREGAQSLKYLNSKKVEFIILYEFEHESENKFRVFRVHDHTILDEEKMRKMNYKNPKGRYYCYKLSEEVSLGKFDISKLISLHRIGERENFIEGSPIIISGKELLKYRII